MLLTECPASRVVLARSVGAMGDSAKPHLLTMLGSHAEVDATGVDLAEYSAGYAGWRNSAHQVLQDLQTWLPSRDDSLGGFLNALAPIVVELLVEEAVSEIPQIPRVSWLGTHVVRHLVVRLADENGDLRVREASAVALGGMRCELG